jgi:hypothetical protein
LKLKQGAKVMSKLNKNIKLLPILSILVFSTANADNCIDVIALSKIKHTVVKDKSSFEQHASNFCKEYSKSSGSTKSSSYGVSYKFLSLSMGNSGANEEEIASKFCSASDNTQLSENAYREYVETISPNAFASYNQCKLLSERNVNFSLANMQPHEIAMTISFDPSPTDKSAKISYSSSADVNCSWILTEEDGADNKSTVIKDGGSTILQCSRKDRAVNSFVILLRADGTKAVMNINWGSYNEEGLRVDSLADAGRKITALQTKQTLLETALKASEVTRTAGDIDVYNRVVKLLQGYVHVGRNINLKSIDGYLYSNRGQQGDEKALLITDTANNRTSWKIE